MRRVAGRSDMHALTLDCTNCGRLETFRSESGKSNLPTVRPVQFVWALMMTVAVPWFACVLLADPPQPT
jgi:hypothetical protein